MKRTYLLPALILLIFSWGTAFSQETYSQDFTIPLSNPNSPGKLKVDLHNGGITVEGYSGKEVVVTIKTHKEKEKEKDVARTKDGLKRIPNTGMDFEMREDDNVVYINGSHRGRADFIVKVPKQFALSLGTHHNGEVLVRNVSGEIEVDAHHGGMKLENVGGSVVADTHHGGIEVSFASIKSGVPMAFSTYHGDVDITFPSSVNASAKMKSERGDIFTDFEMEMTTPEPKIQSSGKGGKKIVVSSWIYSKLGSGGPEFMLNTHHGDIILRKN